MHFKKAGTRISTTARVKVIPFLQAVDGDAFGTTAG